MLGGQQVRFRKGGDTYDLGFTPLDRLYRIDRDQPLGAFAPNRAFTVDLTAKLVAKYGPIGSDLLPGGPAFWAFNEPVQEADGRVFKREAESLSVMLTGVSNISPMGLHMKLMSFHILREDSARANGRRAGEAEGRVRF